MYYDLYCPMSDQLLSKIMRHVQPQLFLKRNHGARNDRGIVGNQLHRFFHVFAIGVIEQHIDAHERFEIRDAHFFGFAHQLPVDLHRFLENQ